MDNLLLLTVSLFLTVTAAKNATYKRMCYYTNWSETMPSSARYQPEDINPFYCTHICFAFTNLRGDLMVSTSSSDESVPGRKGLYERIIDLKKKNPALKVLITLGGWAVGSAPFTHLVSSEAHRKDFIDHAIIWMRTRGFDGLDIDWEYPASRGSPPKDKERFSVLLKETQEAFQTEAKKSGKEKLTLSVAVTTGRYSVNTAYDVPLISKYCDHILLMTYDFHGTWEKYIGHNTPLFAQEGETGYRKTQNIAWTVNNWIKKGADPQKLILGLATFGRGFTLTSPSNSAPGSTYLKPGNPGPLTNDLGVQAYYEICQMVNDGGKVTWMEDQKVPYVVKGDQWYGYDNLRSMKLKVEWMKSKGLGGIFVWSLALDDFAGLCGGRKHPLMKAILEALGVDFKE